MLARWVILPSLPTAVLMRANSFAIFSFSSSTSFSVSATFPATPILSTGMRAEKSPFLKAVKTFNSSRVSRVSGVACAVFIRASLGFLGGSGTLGG